MSDDDRANIQMELEGKEPEDDEEVKVEPLNQITSKLNILKGKYVLFLNWNKTDVQENIRNVPLASLLDKLTSNITNANLLSSMLMKISESQFVTNNLFPQNIGNDSSYFSETIETLLEKDKILNEKNQQLTENYLDLYQKKIDITIELTQACYEQINLNSIKKSMKEKKPDEKAVAKYRGKIKIMINIQKFLIRRLNNVDISQNPEIVTIIKAHRNTSI